MPKISKGASSIWQRTRRYDAELDDLGAKLDRQYIDDELHLIGRQGMPWERVADVATTLMHGKDIPWPLPR